MMLRLIFHLPLRQVERFMTAISSLKEVAISAPDPTTLSRRETALPSIAIAKLSDGLLNLVIDSTGLNIYRAGQCAEAATGVAVLNRMLQAGRPNSVRCAQKST